GGICTDATSNPDHCGADCHPCSAGETCDNGTCGAGGCSAGLTACLEPSGSTACVNLALGYPHCGSCDIICGPAQTCVSGVCGEYLPATPCTSCPCEAECTAALGAASTCCSGLYVVGTVPICIQGSACP